jgi:hypothetical protein
MEDPPGVASILQLTVEVPSNTTFEVVAGTVVGLQFPEVFQLVLPADAQVFVASEAICQALTSSKISVLFVCTESGPRRKTYR